MATVSLKDVKKSFGVTDVIQGISTDIADGEFIVIVGPSGCGKSTLLRMIAGLETVSAGEVFIGGDLVNEKEPMDRDIAMVFQNYALYPHMTVRQNMGYGLKIAKMPKEQIDAKVVEAAKLLQLEPLLDRRPKQLSGGQRQRVAMGRAIVREPAVFLFDEPLSNLDAKLRVQMRLEIRELQEKLGVTSLYVTHDQVEAMTMADRMIVMRDGIAEQIGTPLEVYETPSSVFAAQFIGSPAMNIFEGSLNSQDIYIRDTKIGHGLNNVNGPVKIGLRPEHLIQDPNGPMEIVIQNSEPLGANTLLHGKLTATDDTITVSIPGVYFPENKNTKMRFSIDLKNIHLFDLISEKRLTV
ncbi:sn-glycerol-3-phosphate ABC transporter ATP-binding protein UgpC [Candidatus Pseudothioglobus sp. Uisw_041]|jgi:sn-glycerol 3-phosphate transport system ATP-binding protein|uniref:ABC transporter ATP-binding protein n=1 Tax=unclassified Candidatus Pseudothioglobus TaxID=3072908 RepID=UPI0029734F63|nr:sn-glycerol-3-phosphate ABC transporter ATP-binding protein UgpC [Candidatus Thioglobus sp.]|tara:strand:+ start:4348 stop:5406 length:1059 start_codon:yes stop_codon:yes gene_type:complete